MCLLTGAEQEFYGDAPYISRMTELYSASPCMAQLPAGGAIGLREETNQKTTQDSSSDAFFG
jgi:hypothetical protein